MLSLLALIFLSSTPASLWSEAARLEAAGRPGQGAAILKELTQRDPQNYALQTRTAWLHFQAKEYKAAEHHYFKALEIAPKSWEGKEGLAWSQHYQKRSKEAAATLEGLAADHPENLTRALRLAYLHFQMGAYKPAEARYRRAVALDETSWPAHAGLAWSLHHQGKAKPAAEAVEQLSRLQPKSYTLSMKLAWMHFQMKAYRDAEARYRAALSQSLSSYDARVGLAWSLYYQEKQGEAGELFKALLKERPSDKAAKLGYDLTHLPWYWTLELGGTNHDYGKHPDVTSGFSGKVGLTVANEHWRFQTSFQRDQFHYEPRSENWNNAEESDIEQGAFFGGVGYGGPRFGLQLQGVYVSSNFLDPAPWAGAVTGRWSPWGSIALTLALGQVSGDRITSERLRWTLPLTHSFLVEPSATVTQDLDGAQRLWGDLKLQFMSGPVSVFASAGGGEHRNAFEPPSFYSLTGLMKWRASGGGQFTLMGRYFVSAFVEMAEFESDDGTIWAESNTVMWTGGALGATFMTQ